MKKNTPFVMIAVLSLLIMQHANATIWRVNNKSNYDGSTQWGENFGGSPGYPVFPEVDYVVSFGATQDGDTVQIEPSTSIYATANINRRLVLIGNGYFITSNAKSAATTLESQIARIVFNPGSEGSYAMGLGIVNAGLGADGIVYVYTNSITVKRCRIERYVAFQSLLADVNIVQNFFPSTYATNCLATNGLGSFVPPTDLIFNNNICQKSLTWGSPLATPTTYFPILQCRNNVFDGVDNLTTPQLAFSTSDFSNNILMPTNAKTAIQASSGVIRYNIGTLANQFGTADNNLVVAAISSLFVTSTSPDAAYQIAPSTVAANSGSDGTDRGAFGGTSFANRYTLSGLAPIPVLYEITTAGIANASGLPVIIKARTIQ